MVVNADDGIGRSILKNMCGGGEDGGVDVDKRRCRCTSPRNTLPMWDISRLDQSKYRGVLRERARATTCSVRARIKTT